MTLDSSTAVPGLKPTQNEIQTFEVPRPGLTLAQAAAILGKSIRTIERSLAGRWGNKLPEGWSARKSNTESGEEWVIVPPPGFRLRQSQAESFQPPAEADHGLSLPRSTKRLWKPENHRLEHPAIVIDRSEEVEYLLRELLSTQKALSEERRLHMEDIRLVAQLTGSVRLLENSASESTRIKSELEAAKKELEDVKRDYNNLVNLPWWKKLLAFFTK